MRLHHSWKHADTDFVTQEVSNRGSPEAARLGALQALAALSDVHGQSLASSAMESLALAVKFTARCGHYFPTGFDTKHSPWHCANPPVGSCLAMPCQDVSHAWWACLAPRHGCKPVVTAGAQQIRCEGQLILAQL